MLRLLVKGAVLALLLNVGAILGFPYFQYLMMQRAVEEAADTGVAQLETLEKGPWRQELVLREVTAAVTTLMQDRANRVGLALPSTGVQVSLEPNLFRLGTGWETEARLPGYAQRYRFRVEAKRILVR